MCIEPKCRHFGVCGGCQSQHVPYDEQLAHKEAFISRCFGRRPEPILPCDPVWRYRNKMEFSFAQARSGEKFLGLMKRRGRVENLEECYLTGAWFLEVVKKIRLWWQQVELNAYHPPTNQGLLRTLTLREGIHSKEKMIMLTVSEAPFDDRHISSFMEALPEVDALILRRQIIQKKTPTRFEERVLQGKNHIHEILHDTKRRPYRFRIRGASFFQPNTAQAEKIYQKAIEYADLKKDEHVLDLYCGTGSLGIFACTYAARTLGIEIAAEAVQDANVNLTLNGISNMEVLEGDVSEQLRHLCLKPATVFVDPPRAGVGSKTIEHLIKLNPQKIVYISCNPVTQAADCKALHGYEILSLQPIDQFPHTPHIENIALLRRKT
jgi:23S rRNA (uracil1939-C5)-methyltransferase